MLARRLLPPWGNRPESMGTTLGLGKAGCELRLRFSPGHFTRATGRRCRSGDPPGIAMASKRAGQSRRSRGKGSRGLRAATLQKHSLGRVQTAPPADTAGTHRQEWVLPTAPSPFSHRQAGTGTPYPSKSKPGFPLALPAVPITHSLFVRSPFPFRAH